MKNPAPRPNPTNHGPNCPPVDGRTCTWFDHDDWSDEQRQADEEALMESWFADS